MARLRLGRLSLKQLLPRTLFGRSFLIIVTPLVLAQMVATFVFYDRHWEAVTRSLASAVVGDIQLTIDQLARDGSPVEQTRTLALVSRTTDLILTLHPGRVLEGTERRPAFGAMLKQTLWDAMASDIHKPFVISTPSIDGREWVRVDIQLEDGVLTVLCPERRLYSFTSYLFILWMIGSAIVLFAIAILFMRNQIRPIRRLAAAADSFGKGRDVPYFKPEGATEVRQAAHAFLVMRERLGRQIAQRTEMLAGVSHDLRTPLTRMRLLLAMLPDSGERADLEADVGEMETMIEGYLAFARGESGESPQPTDLPRLVTEVVNAARREGMLIDLHIEGAMTLPLRPVAVRRCLANLIANAQRYARHVWVEARRRSSVVEIVVDDDGPGIPERLREDVFRPFYRVDSSRNQATGGVGLGLTIARDVARFHGGDIALSDSPRGGLRAVVRLPV